MLFGGLFQEGSTNSSFFYTGCADLAQEFRIPAKLSSLNPPTPTLPASASPSECTSSTTLSPAPRITCWLPAETRCSHPESG